ncbi:MAG: hypothetical protein IJA20_10050 [Methanocorpusculum sp.]|nr:hypothetical protein [Methanocorpusculum sp.]
MKVMKRTFYALTALLLLAAFFGGAAAAAEQSITIDVPSTEVPWNEKTTVPVTIHGPVEIGAVTIDLPEIPGVIISVNETQNPLGATINNENDGAKYTWLTLSKTGYLNADTVLCYLDIVPDVSTPVTKVEITVIIDELADKSLVDQISTYPVKPATLKIQKAPSIATMVVITAPVGDTELAYGTEGTAVAVVYDQYGDVMEDEPVTWSVCKSDSTEPATGLSIDANGNYKVVNCAEGTVQIFAAAGTTSTCNVVKLVKADLEADDFTVTGLGEFVWTGQPFAVTVEAKDNGVGDITVTYNGASEAPTAKGTYAVNISVTDGDNYNEVANLFLGEVKITGTVIVPPTLGTFPTYNGEEQTIDLVDSANSAGMYDVSGNTGTDAGNYMLTLTLKDTVNTEWKDADSASITLDWKILPKSLADAVIEATAVTYTGEEQTPEFTVTLDGAILAADTDYTLDVEGSIAAGDYTVTVTGKGNYEGTASATWTIAKAVPTAEMISCEIPDDLVYTGESQTLTASVKDGIYGLGAVTLMYNGAEAAVDAGEYAVTANVAEGTNYTAAADLAVGTLTIGKADLDKDDFTLSATSAEYNGKPQEVTVAPKVDGVAVTAIKYTGDANAPSAKGTYTITISATGGNNYNDVADLEVGTFVITGRQVAEPEITGSYTYTGAELTAVIAESADYKVTGNKATAAGTHIVTVSLMDKANTAWKNGETDDLKLNWVIAPKSIAGAGVTTSTENDAFTYDGTVKVPTFIVTDGALSIAETDYSVEGDSSSAVAGKHQVTIVGQNNYTGEVKAEWQIAQAVPVIENMEFTIPTGVVYGQTYEVTADAAEGVVGLGEITLLYNGTATAPVNAGTYLVNASIAAGVNYTAAEIELGTLVIAKAVPVIENITFAIPVDVVYDGKEHAATATAAEGVVGLGAIKLLYNDAEAVPVAAGTYKVNASVAAGDNYEAAVIELGELTIAKATLTKADLVITPELPVSYEAGSAEAVVVTVKEGILGNGTITVKYSDATTVPSEAGIYKVNATFEAGVNYTAADIYLGDMTVVATVAPGFGDIGVANDDGSHTITGGDVDSENNTTTLESNGVQLVIAFSDMTAVSGGVKGNITGVTVIYPEAVAASPKAGDFAYNLTINLGNKLTTLLPDMSGVYNNTVATKVSSFLGTKATFDGLVMLTATGDNVDDINANITAGNGNIQIVFKIPKATVSDKSKLVVYHVGNNVKKATIKSVAEDGEFWLVTVTGNGFSSYVAGIETAAPSGGNGGGSAIIIPSSGKTPSSGDVPTETPSDEPSDDPTDVPGDVPYDIPGTTPSEPGKSPAPVAGMILGALAAAAVLRRK